MPLISAATLDFRRLPGRLSADPLPPGFPGCAVRIVRVPPGPRTPHRHPRTPEVVYVVIGTGTAWEDGTAQRVSAGDVLAIAAGVPHATVADDDGGLLLVLTPR